MKDKRRNLQVKTFKEVLAEVLAPNDNFGEENSFRLLGKDSRKSLLFEHWVNHLSDKGFLSNDFGEIVYELEEYMENTVKKLDEISLSIAVKGKIKKDDLVRLEGVIEAKESSEYVLEGINFTTSWRLENKISGEKQIENTRKELRDISRFFAMLKQFRNGLVKAGIDTCYFDVIIEKVVMEVENAKQNLETYIESLFPRFIGKGHFAMITKVVIFHDLANYFSRSLQMLSKGQEDKEDREVTKFLEKINVLEDLDLDDVPSYLPEGPDDEDCSLDDYYKTYGV
ncbi:hypothetical protein [Natranaerofaba carboxydovora]|uniref:hypothetical protein n=1 Tax=Natranaerofaba carboxydovora TaxID=2742683 RepID=UPI001F148595|nr:hypothetical protein [Natranaerofaba carboxydovora]